MVKRVLVCGLVKNVGGLEKIVFDFYNNIDTNEFEFEFLLQGEEEIDFSEHSKAINKNKLVVHRIPHLLPNLRKSLKEWDKFFKENAHRYDILWANLNALNHVEFVRLAKKYGIQKRIIHAHCDSAHGKSSYLHPMFRPFVGVYATDFWACSEKAADFFYHRGIRNKALVINNAIELEQFIFDLEKRKKIRTEYNIPDDALVLGQVGRLVDFNKYQSYSIRVFAEVVKKNPNSRLMLIGRGDTIELERLAEELNVRDKVIFTGVKNDVGEMLNALDVFVFPSKFEGLGIVLIEAQANGLPVVTGEHLPAEAKINDNYNNTLSLEAEPSAWAEAIFHAWKIGRISEEEIRKRFKERSYNIQEEVKKLEKLLKEGRKR